MLLYLTFKKIVHANKRYTVSITETPMTKKQNTQTLSRSVLSVLTCPPVCLYLLKIREKQDKLPVKGEET
jgi:hypothetical protein